MIIKQPARSENSQKGAHPPVNILLAEDDADDRYFFQEALHDFSLPTDLSIVSDGEQLMQRLTEGTQKLPDVIFLDLNMPRKNGFECLAEIKVNEKLKQLPVIIYSTSFHKKIGEMLYENGANYYISKPSEISQLKKAVQQMITLIAENKFSQPTKDNFMLTVERKNYKTKIWFKHFFVIPFSENSN